MRRCSLFFLSFERLLCGSEYHIQNTFPNPDVQRDLLSVWQSLGGSEATDAPPPPPLALHMTSTMIQNHRVKDALTVLTTHPQKNELVRSLCQHIEAHKTLYSFEALRETFELARVSKVLPCEALLRLLGAFCDGNERVSDHQREEVRALVLQEITFKPFVTPTLFATLCQLSAPTESHLEEVLQVLEWVQKGGVWIDPSDFIHVLRLCRRCQREATVGELWGWMQHTSAAWERETASLALVCLCQGEKSTAAAVDCVKAMTAVHLAPTREAQIAFLRLLQAQEAVNTDDVHQLLALWYPSSTPLWTRENWEVGREALRVLARWSHKKVMMDLLEALHRSEDLRYQDWAEEVPAPVFTALLHRNVIQEAVAHDLCFRYPLSHPRLAVHPEWIGIIVLYSYHTKQGVLESLQQHSLTLEDFNTLCKFVTEEGMWLTATEKLEILRKLSLTFHHPIPKEVESWLDLLGSMNK